MQLQSCVECKIIIFSIYILVYLRNLCQWSLVTSSQNINVKITYNEWHWQHESGEWPTAKPQLPVWMCCKHLSKQAQTHWWQHIFSWHHSWSMSETFICTLCPKETAQIYIRLRNQNTHSLLTLSGHTATATQPGMLYRI